ncbi:hypothetical protein GCM10010472_52240 [Pseudonocardia halophobica]|uniref:FtsK domain-containing protein n=1 Tax=Pseudonocardia halophobica TaxID=29401 RepID=A0A9W6L3D0_9PSEU|nr:FtsK/SpoIIIE domain-containing protein [Pseudonocardia halophobica]GLL11360.1 hypothetical protein GCM10017577_25010 [Pseudonocardia halophobica]
MTATNSGAPARFPGVGAPARPGWRTRRRHHAEHRADQHAAALTAERLIWAWRQACEGAGASRTVDTPSGPTVSTPAVASVTLGPPTVLIVRLLPGQLPEDLRKAAPRLAPHLGAVALRVEPRGLGWARVELLDRDPLADPYRIRHHHAGPVLLGLTESGPLWVDPPDLPHMICQGQTRSGKSTWTYGLLAQLAHRRTVRIAGVDASGLTLRPFAVADRVVSGLADLDRVEHVLAALVDDMDTRLTAMPVDRDVLPVDDHHPLILVVLEEWPGILRALDTADTRQGKRVRALVARLLAESHKVGMRVLLLAQRAEATIVGAAERAQCAGRLSFRVDSPEAVKLLHAGAEDLAPDHAGADPGIALYTWPGLPVGRLRAPYLSYAEYARAVAP